MSKKIAIVGGGISGLHCANLLEKNGHSVTIFEKNTWGGVMQNHTVDGKDYPISTIFPMPGGEFMKYATDQKLVKIGFFLFFFSLLFLAQIIDVKPLLIIIYLIIYDLKSMCLPV